MFGTVTEIIQDNEHWPPRRTSRRSSGDGAAFTSRPTAVASPAFCGPIIPAAIAPDIMPTKHMRAAARSVVNRALVEVRTEQGRTQRGRRGRRQVPESRRRSAVVASDDATNDRRSTRRCHADARDESAAGIHHRKVEPPARNEYDCEAVAEGTFHEQVRGRGGSRRAAIRRRSGCYASSSHRSKRRSSTTAAKRVAA